MISVINKRDQHKPGPRHLPGTTVVYIGRPGIFGNPARIGHKCPFCDAVHSTGEATLPCYKRYLWKRMHNDGAFNRELRRLLNIHHSGHLLLECWCKPMPCHGDILKNALLWMDNNPIK